MKQLNKMMDKRIFRQWALTLIIVCIPIISNAQVKWALRRLLGDWAYGVYFSSYFGMIDMKYPHEVNEKGLIAINSDKTVDHLKKGYFAVQNLTAIFDDKIKQVNDFEYEVQHGKDQGMVGEPLYTTYGGRQDCFSPKRRKKGLQIIVVSPFFVLCLPRII